MPTIAIIIAGTATRIAPTALIGARRTRVNLTASMEGWMAVSNAITGTGATAIRMRARVGIAMTAIATGGSGNLQNGCRAKARRYTSRDAGSFLLEVAALAGLDQFVEILDLALQPRVVAPILILREGERLLSLLQSHAFGDGVFHGGVFVGQHGLKFLDVLAMRNIAVGRKDDVVIVSGGNLIEQLDPIIHRCREGHIRHAVGGKCARREKHAILRK